MIESYPSIYNLGHSAITDLFKEAVIVEEKIDGSQISFSKSLDGTLSMRSKGAQINLSSPEGMFSKAVVTLNEIAPLLRPGFTYRGEYLSSPHHNSLTYSRVPAKHIIVFDVNTGQQAYATPDEKKGFAAELGLETVPVLFIGHITSPNELRSFLKRESVLGGSSIEGVVIKPASYDLFGRDKKVLMGKFVSEAFREVHARTWASEHKTPGADGILQILNGKFATETRWQKAVQHLRESGALEQSPRDIPLLMKEVQDDVLRECESEIRDDLMKWAWPQLRRTLTRGLPEWWKDQLLKTQFTESPPTT